MKYEPQWLGEILFGLIMVLTFTLGADMIVAEGPMATRELLQDVLGCIFAWSLIDAMNFVMIRLFERSRSARLIEAVQVAPNDAQGLAIIQNELEPKLQAFSSKEERTSLYRDVFRTVKAVAVPKTRIEMEEIGGALVTFLLVMLTAVPALGPFLFIGDRYVALRVSNGLLLGMLYSRRLLLGPCGENEPVVDGPGRHADRRRHGGCRQNLRRMISVRRFTCRSHIHPFFRCVLFNTCLPGPTSFNLDI
jgi:hypothetical protein